MNTSDVPKRQFHMCKTGSAMGLRKTKCPKVLINSHMWLHSILALHEKNDVIESTSFPEILELVLSMTSLFPYSQPSSQHDPVIAEPTGNIAEMKNGPN